jgi:hypothetical protein
MDAGEAEGICGVSRAITQTSCCRTLPWCRDRENITRDSLILASAIQLNLAFQ